MRFRRGAAKSFPLVPRGNVAGLPFLGSAALRGGFKRVRSPLGLLHRREATLPSLEPKFVANRLDLHDGRRSAVIGKGGAQLGAVNRSYQRAHCHEGSEFA